MEEEKRETPAVEPKGETLEDIEKEVKARPKRPKPKKRRPGRPTLEEQATKEDQERLEREAVAEMETAAIRGIIEWLGDMAASRLGPWWKVKREEAEAGARAWGVVIADWIPDVDPRKMNLVRALVWTFGTVAPRWEKTRQHMAEEAAKEAPAKKAAPETAEPEAAGPPA